MKKIFILAGDPSGDLIAARLVLALKKINPGCHITAIGGHRLKDVSDAFLANIVQQHALGFAISPKKILYFHRLLNKIISPHFESQPPDLFIPVDFYGFNCRVVKIAKKVGAKVVYYVSPQFWASRSGRADRLRKWVDLFLCLFPFETEFFQSRNIPAQFVGHPLLDDLSKDLSNRDKKKNIELNIGLLPGSRPSEIKRHLPIILDACDLLASKIPPFRLILFTVPNVSRDLYNSLINKSKHHNHLLELVQDENYSWRSQLDFAITASGMETLENTLLGIPMVVIYKTNLLTYLIARMIIKIPFIAMPNVLANKRIVPEFIQSKAQAKLVVAPLLDWINNPEKMEKSRTELLSLRDLFGGPGASTRAAHAICELVN